VQIVSLLGFALPIMILAMSFQYFLSFINPLFDLVLLWIALSISIAAITTLLVRIYLTNLSKEASERHSTNIFKLLVGFSYGIVLAFLIQTEIMFSFDGIGDLFLQAISSGDYYVLNAIIFLTLISFPIFIVLTLVLFYLFGRVKRHHIRKQIK
jgi:ABC-type antimicrobial peptide transport system permease subunit